MNMIAPRLSRMTGSSRRRLVVVGNGMAAMRAVEEILARSPAGSPGAFAITVFGAEPHGSYNRIQLSPVLAGEKAFDSIVTHPHAWYAAHGIELLAGEAVVSIDRPGRSVTGARGTMRPYDVLLLATGSNPVVIPVPGHGLPGVISFRDIGDVRTMRAAAGSGRRAVVIGGGLLGLEAANGLASCGMQTTVVHLMDTLMERQLDPVSADLLRRDLTARGIVIITGANTKAILGEQRVTGVQLADGTMLPADLVVMAVGIRPNTALALDAGLACGRGVQVDDGMLTSDACIYAVGECVEHRGAVFGLVAPLYDMARVAAERITRTADTDYVPAALATRLKVTGIDVFSAGDFTNDDASEVISFRDRRRGVHKRFVLRDNRLVGAVLYGEAGDSAWYFDLIVDGEDVSALRDALPFGPVAAGAARQPELVPA